MPARYPKRGRGFTLIEVIIASGIFLLMLTAIYQCLVLSLRLYHKVRDASEIQAETLRVISHVERSLSGAAVSTVQINPSPLDAVQDRYILFVSAQSDEVYFEESPADGKPVWQRIICFYVVPEPNGRFSLVRKDQKLPLPLSTTLPSALPTKDQMKNDASLPAEVLTRHLTDVAFGDSASISLKLSLLSESNNGLTIYTRVATHQ